MKTIEEIRQFFSGDLFATGLGIGIDRVDGDRAVCSVLLREEFNNAMGNTQGGLIFTLADFAFAVAANNQECRTVTLSSSIHYLRPPKGKMLFADACCRNRGKHTCLYQIDVMDDLNTPVAQLTVTGYIC